MVVTLQTMTQQPIHFTHVTNSNLINKAVTATFYSRHSNFNFTMDLIHTYVTYYNRISTSKLIVEIQDIQSGTATVTIQKH